MNRRLSSSHRSGFGLFAGPTLKLASMLPVPVESSTLVNSKAAASILPAELEIEDSVLTNLYLSTRGKTIVLQSGDGPVGHWFMEDIDFVTDFREAFGHRPPAPAFVAISADSDDTGSRISGAVADIAFEG